MKLLKKHHLKKQILIILYDDENNYIFMDPKTFEQIEIKKDIIGEKGKLMTENLESFSKFL